MTSAMEGPFRIGTRASRLAMWQANHVADLLRVHAGTQPVELVRIETTGDVVQDRPLSAMGGFGVFTHALQDALLQNRIDLAVHSLKDLPTIPVPGLKLACVLAREVTGDAFVSEKHARFDDLPSGAVIGTSSLRRRAMVLSRRPDLTLIDLRGNVDTRLRKLRDQSLDGIILAEAGLKRLGLEARITEVLYASWMLPAVGQGAIGIEIRSGDARTEAVVSRVNDLATWRAITAERTMLAALGGGCLVPIGVTTRTTGDTMTLTAAVLSGDGTQRIERSHSGPANEPGDVGLKLAAKLMDAGAEGILRHGIQPPG